MVLKNIWDIFLMVFSAVIGLSFDIDFRRKGNEPSIVLRETVASHLFALHYPVSYVSEGMIIGITGTIAA